MFDLATLIDSLNRRLGSWKNKFLSLGGRIVLLNSVLNSIPIYYLSFMQMPANVRIQRKFLWGGASEGHKIAWVKWSVVCKSREKRGARCEEHCSF